MYSIGQKVRLTNVGMYEKDYGYKVGDIITIKKLGGSGYSAYNEKGHFFLLANLAPVFEVGDTIRMTEDCDDGFAVKGEIKILEQGSGNYLRTSPNGCTCENKWELIRKGAGMAKSLRNRIEALTGWDKEADDVLREIFKSGITYNGKEIIRIVVDNFVDCSRGYVSLVGHGNYLSESNSFAGEVYKSFDIGSSQCSKLRAFKDALLFLLDKSGLEKKDTEKEELLKQIAELRTHHEQEGRNMKDLQQKHEAEGQRIEELERRIK